MIKKCNEGFNYLSFNSTINNFKSQINDFTTKINILKGSLDKINEKLKTYFNYNDNNNNNNLIKNNNYEILNNIKNLFHEINLKLNNLNEFINAYCFFLIDKCINFFNEINNNKNNDNKLKLINNNNEKLLENKNENINYSYECVNFNNEIDIYEGTKDLSIEITLKNNNNVTWPKNNTKLEFDIHSNLLGDTIILEPQKYNEVKKYLIKIKNSEEYPEGQYECCLYFKVNEKIYGKSIYFNINIT